MKNVVVCFDGTWNSADSGKSETNVAVLARALQANSGDVPQVSLYLRGVGSTGSAIQRIVDGATGDGIDENILSAYMFICQNYEPRDRIFLFGFSRGAFSARSLSGLIGACSLLKRWSLDKVSAAWRFYREEDDRRPHLFAQKTKAEIHDDVRIRFLGVWDTVGSLGVPSTLLNAIGRDRYQFHDTSPSRIVDTARHALAIDEFRDEFVPTFWTAPTRKEAQKAGDIRQVWFAGAHADVGGGYRRHRLADISLMWMADEASLAGLQIDRARVLTPSRRGIRWRPSTTRVSPGRARTRSLRPCDAFWSAMCASCRSSVCILPGPKRVSPSTRSAKVSTKACRNASERR